MANYLKFMTIMYMMITYKCKHFENHDSSKKAVSYALYKTINKNIYFRNELNFYLWYTI